MHEDVVGHDVIRGNVYPNAGCLPGTTGEYIFKDNYPRLQEAKWRSQYLLDISLPKLLFHPCASAADYETSIEKPEDFHGRSSKQVPEPSCQLCLRGSTPSS